MVRGEDGIRTRVHGFAGRCLASRPLHRSWCLRADDETRTRDPNLGKVVRYQLRYIRIALNKELGNYATQFPTSCNIEKRRGFYPPPFVLFQLALGWILAKAVGGFAVDNEVNTGDFLFALDSESDGLLDRESND